jgi:hypothetical protein
MTQHVFAPGDRVMKPCGVRYLVKLWANCGWEVSLEKYNKYAIGYWRESELTPAPEPVIPTLAERQAALAERQRQLCEEMGYSLPSPEPEPTLEGTFAGLLRWADEEHGRRLLIHFYDDIGPVFNFFEQSSDDWSHAIDSPLTADAAYLRACELTGTNPKGDE